MTKFDEKSAKSLHAKEKDEWKESRDEANSTNLNDASPALKQDALTKTKKSVVEDDLSVLENEDLPKKPSKADDKG